MAKKVLSREADFNRRAGFTAAHDRMPEFVLLEKLPPHYQVYAMPEKELDSVLEFTRKPISTAAGGGVPAAASISERSQASKTSDK